mmetsp:Transcript_718/g.1601  ORF Transcript_718/g.1601 Transcript_718/m.1601 type:complete len:256 (+) Transcript_718:77-844(+)
MLRHDPLAISRLAWGTPTPGWPSAHEQRVRAGAPIDAAQPHGMFPQTNLYRGRPQPTRHEQKTRCYHLYPSSWLRTRATSNTAPGTKPMLGFGFSGRGRNSKMSGNSAKSSSRRMLRVLMKMLHPGASQLPNTNAEICSYSVVLTKSTTDCSTAMTPSISSLVSCFRRKTLINSPRERALVAGTLLSLSTSSATLSFTTTPGIPVTNSVRRIFRARRTALRFLGIRFPIVERPIRPVGSASKWASTCCSTDSITF